MLWRWRLYCFLVSFSTRKWLLQVPPKRTHLATVFSFLTLSSRKVRHAVCILCKTADCLVYPSDWRLLFSRMSCHVVLWNYTKISEKLLLPSSSYTDAAGCRFFLNVALLLAEYLMLHSRKQQPSVNFKSICSLFSFMHVVVTIIWGGCFSFFTFWLAVDSFVVGVFSENCLVERKFGVC